MLTEEEAIKAGEELLAKMRTKGKWKVRVWNNMGWHYSLKGANISLYAYIFRDDPPRYHAMIGTNGSGEAMWTDQGSFKDPNEAVIKALEAATKKVSELQEMVKNAMECFVTF